MPKGVPMSEEVLRQLRKEIINTAAQLFVEKGFSGTPMREIAEAAGLGKSTLYDYFQTKDEILIFYFEDAITIISERAQKIIQQNSSITEKLKKIMRMHLEYLVDNKNLFLHISSEAQQLSNQSQERIQSIRHGYQDLLRTLIEAGIQNKEFRPVNPLLAARSIFALLSITVFTSRPSGTPEDMLNDALMIYFDGIKA